MQFVTYKGERSLSDLARRVFNIKGAKAVEQTKQAVAALLQANPHLGDLKSLGEGAPIIVPAVPGLTAAATQPGVTDQVMANLQDALKNAETSLGQSLSREMEEAKVMAQLAKDRRLAGLAKGSPEIRDRLAQTVKAVDERLKDIGSRKKSISQGLAQLQKDMGDLSGN